MRHEMKGCEYSPENWAIGVFKDKLLIYCGFCFVFFLLQKMKQKLQQYLILILQKPLIRFLIFCMIRLAENMRVER